MLCAFRMWSSSIYTVLPSEYNMLSAAATAAEMFQVQCEEEERKAFEILISSSRYH